MKKRLNEKIDLGTIIWIIITILFVFSIIWIPVGWWCIFN